MADKDRTTQFDQNGGPSEKLEPTAALTIVSHPDLSRIGDTFLFEKMAGCVRVSRNEPFFSAPDGTLARALEDEYISRRPFELTLEARGNMYFRQSDSPTRVIAGSRDTADEQRFTFAEIRKGISLELSGRICLLLHEAMPPHFPLPDQLGFVGDSTGINLVREDILRIADLDVPVLIRGESGTGKELIADAIHRRSSRRGKKMVCVNMGAIPPSLAAGELFGAVRGAYTGATLGKEGYFRAAHGGTLFLDEIGEAPPEVQAMLMRVLETGEVHVLGSSKPLSVNVRLLAATDANLEDMSHHGAFKAPLLHRLGDYQIWTPPLRLRRDDIMRLFIHFAGEIRRDLGLPEPHELKNTVPWIPTALAAILVNHHWPGNVRELRNVTRQLMIDHQDRLKLEITSRLGQVLNGHLGRAGLKEPAVSTGAIKDSAMSVPSLGRRKPAQVSEKELIATMATHRWEPAKVARALGITRSSVYALIKKFDGLRTVEDIPGEEIALCLAEHDGRVEETAATLKVSVHGLRRKLVRLGLT